MITIIVVMFRGNIIADNRGATIIETILFIIPLSKSDRWMVSDSPSTHQQWTSTMNLFRVNSVVQ